MIDRCVYSYWNVEGESNTSAFLTFRDFLASITLSMLVSKRNFNEVALVTNDFGKKVLIDRLELPFTEVNLELNNQQNLSKLWWAYTKLKAYSIQEKPFVHIDNDSVLWDGLPKELSESKMCFQSIETPFEDGYGWYKHLLKTAEKAGYFPQLVKENPVDYSFNCGICGGNDLDIFKEWIKLSESYIFAKENEEFFKDSDNLLIHQNLLHEQYFISSLTKSKGWKPNKDIKFLIDYTDIFEDCYRSGHKFTHLWGTVKKDRKVMERLYERLKKDFPSYYNKIMKYNVVIA